jgi:ectoine hydroxylase-related dioxygenase (phytanoyl-CoA dioxygenase family)
MERMAHTLSEDGFEIVPSVLNTAEVAQLCDALEKLERTPGHRNLMRRVPAVAELAQSPAITALVESRLEAPCFPVRSIFFDKTTEANWFVPWHQDLTIAVKERRDAPGYGPWTVKEGVPHVQPPMQVLESMVTLRLHLDDCDESKGALRVIPGSHRRGRLGTADIAALRREGSEFCCSTRAGGALLIRPLLLHASSEAWAPGHRRVIHLEYATLPLSHGLEWAEETTPPSAPQTPPG